ncbi:MAG: GNAT family N-acetyltransferase [bacterium]|nr:GNAT family N-acetyltransferase [bacterium]
MNRKSNPTSDNDWRREYSAKLLSAREAVNLITNGQSVFIGSAAGEPLALTQALAEDAGHFWDIELIHLSSVQAESILARPELTNHFRYNTFYIGRGLSAAVSKGQADYTPMNVSEMPAALRDGSIQIDVALIQVSPPDEYGTCCLGPVVDVARAAVESAGLVIAQVNEHVPVTLGDTLLQMEFIDWLVERNEPISEVAPHDLDPISLTIGRHIASLIDDGSCLHFDHCPISSATMRYLDTKHDLGIHTDILTDDILRLFRLKAVNNQKKKFHRGKSVATMVMGSRDLYETVDRNPYFELLPIDQINAPELIACNPHMIAVQAVEEMELTGLARAENHVTGTLRSLPSSTDFISGANRSEGGFSIMALPSTSPDGKHSRIVPLSTGGGVAFPRSKAHYVVTEYGMTNLYGLSVRERAVALISIAHPKFRAELLEEAKRLNYVSPDHVIPPEHGSIYPQRYEVRKRFKNDVEIFFRPVKPCDARRLQRMFYTLSPKSVRMRYHGAIKTLSDRIAQKLATIDYSADIAIVGVVGPRHKQRIVAEGRIMYNPANNMGEFDIAVAEDFQGQGIGTFLASHLNKIAYSRNLDGLYAEVIAQNSPIIALLERAWPTTSKHFDSGYCTFTLRYKPADITKPKDSIIVYSGRYSQFSYGQGHPFKPERARDALQLIRQEGYLSEPWIRVEEPVLISKERLAESHDRDYLDALEAANDGSWHERLLAFNIGGDECPLFKGIFDYMRLFTSATSTAVDLITDENANIVFNPLGGFHHASRAHAEGFCYANDAIMAIDRLLARGFRVAYVDIDAHHGNGVQDAYYDDDRVLFIDLHQFSPGFYPHSGAETELGEKLGKGYTINIPLPPGCDDEAYLEVFRRVAKPALERFNPTVIVSVIGADTHRSDPLSELRLTNNGQAEAVRMLRENCHHLLLLGGGGYETKTTTRSWARMWAAANLIDELPEHMLVMGGVFMGGQGLTGADIIDPPYQLSGDEKGAIMREILRIAEFHERNSLPLIT